MRLRLIFSIVGTMGILCGISMMAPVVVDFLFGFYESAERSAVSSMLAVLVGMLIYILADAEKEPLKVKEMFLTTTLIWGTYTLLGAVPFAISQYDISWTNAVFESASGLTTTGSTVLTGLDDMAPGLLLWRSMLQWIGGAGIVILAITILPTLHIGGMQFFTTESSGGSERDLPTVTQNMRAILIYFIGLTIACGGCLKLAGMSAFDAVNHAMTTISTGGFSTHDASIGFFASPTIEWLLILFMILSALPLLLGLHVWQRRWRPIREDVQIGSFFKVVLLALVFLTILRWSGDHFAPSRLIHYVREGLFAITSVISSTGFVTENYQLWGNFAVAFFMFLMLVGGCTGSTAGGIKMFRFAVLSRAANVRLKTLVQPHGVFVPRYGNHVISDDVLISVLVFIGLYLGTAILTTLALSVCGLDFVTCFSGAISALSNVGPALGHIIGPDKNFASLSDTVKWILIIAMIVGRLEFISVFVLFFPFLWRKNA